MPNWKKLIVSGSEAKLSNLYVDNAVTASYFVGDGSGLTGVTTEIVETATVSDTFTSVTSRVVTHNFGTKDVITTVYNDSDEQILPSSIVTTTINSVTVTFDNATSGRIVVAKGGHIVQGLGTAADSNTLNGESGSYYLDYSNFTNIPSGIISGSQQIDSLTRYEQSITGNTQYTVTHNLNEDYPIVQVYDTDKLQVLPGIISASNSNTVFIQFDSNFTGKVVVKK